MNPGARGANQVRNSVLLLALAWFEGGEEPLHPIAEDVALPEQGQ